MLTVVTLRVEADMLIVSFSGSYSLAGCVRLIGFDRVTWRRCAGMIDRLSSAVGNRRVPFNQKRIFAPIVTHENLRITNELHHSTPERAGASPLNCVVFGIQENLGARTGCTILYIFMGQDELTLTLT
jgi:hypothetical protein